MTNILDRAEYSDLYKFLTSIGLLLVGTSILLPWLFLKEGLAVNVSQEDYDNMLCASQALTRRRLDLIATSLSTIKWLSPILFSLGLLITVIGIKRWSGKQARLDEIDQLEIDELRARVKPIEKSEYQAKAKEEIRQEAESSSPIGEQTAAEPISSVDVPDPGQDNNERLANELVEVESTFFDKFTEYNSFDYRVQQNVKFADRYSVDILLAAYNRAKHKDKLIEIKYLQTRLNMDAALQARQDLQRAMNYYNNTTRRSVQSVLIFVYKLGITSDDEVLRFRQAMSDQSRPPLTILIMADSEVSAFDVKSLIT